MQVNLQRYKMCNYVDGGRGPVNFDCWGWIRFASNEFYGKPLLPSFGYIRANDKRSLTKASKDMLPLFEKTDDREDGTIACVYMRSILCHIGIIINGKVSHFGSGIGGMAHDSIEHFERMSGGKVVYLKWQD